MKSDLVKRIGNGVAIHSDKELLCMSVFSKEGSCLLSQELPQREMMLTELKGTLLVVLNFVGGEYFATMIY